MQITVLEEGPGLAHLRFMAQGSDPQSVLDEWLLSQDVVLWQPSEISAVDHEGSQLAFEAKLHFLPAVKLPGTLFQPLEVPLVPVPSEDDLLDDLNTLQLMHASEQEHEGPAEMGHRLYIDLVALVGEQPIPLSARSQMPIVLAPELFFPGFAEALVGAQVGESIEIKTRLPLDYAFPAWRGRTAVYSVYIQRICTLAVLTPLALADVVSVEPSETALLEWIQTQAQAQAQQDWSQAIKQLLLAQLLPQAVVEVPEALLQAEMRALWQRTDAHALTEQGIEDDLLEKSWQSFQRFTELREACYWQLCCTLFLRAVLLAHPEYLGDTAAFHQELQTLATAFATPIGDIEAEVGNQVLDILALDHTLDYLVAHTPLLYQGQPILTLV